MKNYITFVNDHSSSMIKHAAAAIKDFNNNITAVKDAASAEMLDTVVSVVAIGLGRGYRSNMMGYGVERQITVSNPHVLKPVSAWPTPGGTPLYDGIGDMIEMCLSLPDADKPDVSFLVMINTDGEEQHSEKYTEASLAALISKVNATGRWTFVMRVPKGAYLTRIRNLGIPADNIQQWDTSSAAGITQTTQANTQAMTSYFAARSAGAKSSSSFYANAAAVNLAALEDVTKKVSLYVVPQESNGIEIRPFILSHRMDYLKGAAFYQLTKTESKVSFTKQILVRDRATGKIFAGKDARNMIGLPSDRNARLHPGDHKNFDIFIQSESVNRKLVAGTGVVYWKEIGVPFTAADLAYLQPKAAVPAAPAVVQLPAVPVSHAPTKSPIPVTPKFEYFETREEARRYCNAHSIRFLDMVKNPTAPKEKRWAVPKAKAKAPATA